MTIGPPFPVLRQLWQLGGDRLDERAAPGCQDGALIRCAQGSGRGCLPCDQANLLGNWCMMPLLSKSARAMMCRWMAS